MLSNGPGDPSECVDIIKRDKEALRLRYTDLCNLPRPSAYGTCQRRRDRKDEYGHRGANHPVKFLNEDRTYLSSQNHGYMVSGKGRTWITPKSTA